MLDDLSSGLRELVPTSAEFVQGSVADTDLVAQIARNCHVEAVLHFAGSTSVPESVAQPLEYYRNNTVASARLLQVCAAHRIRHFVFSSTAAVYGATDFAPVRETASTVPLTPYGRSKLMVEWMLEDVARVHDFRYVVLRYFNVAGNHPHGLGGQPATKSLHLIKRAAQVAAGVVDHLDVFGSDYPTHDGTAVRDYIHVCDLVDAHLLALDHLRNQGGSSVLNCGYGQGASVLDVVCAFERVTGHSLAMNRTPRRAGDAAFVVADPTRLRDAFGWQPKYNRLDEIVDSALSWEMRQDTARP